ncbi:unnamed protein product [Arctia plantaginis]|uniref:Uncharacterized protein n=1 Tax=Arctia plantaginis TaxID=874455 RepID=A0A8S0Z1H9_ARCPL|nr:unnamed protein product [Arctia plantaginis]
MPNYVQSNLPKETIEQREHRLSLIYERLLNKSAEQCEYRLTLIRERLSHESAEQHEYRFSLAGPQSAQVLLSETAEERAILLTNMHARDNRRLPNFEQFNSAINVFADVA